MNRLTELVEYASDTFTYFLSVISGDHRYIHDGRGFSYIGNTGSLAAGSGTYSVAILTPVDTSGVRLHLRPANLAATANLMLMTVAEGSTVTGGSAVTPVNLNRNSSRVSKATVTAGVTVSAAGTTILQDIVGGGTNPSNNTGGTSNSEHERVLKPNTVYTIKIDNIGASTASTGYFDIYWYEEAKG